MISTEPVLGDVQSNGIHLRYGEWGQGQPVVCLHGLTMNLYVWESLANALSDRYRVIGYDQRGHGDSDKPASGYTFDDYGADLAGLMAALHVERPVLVGHSMGMRTTISYLSSHPDAARAAVLLDSGIDNRPEILSTTRETLTLRLRGYPSWDDFFDSRKKQPYYRNWSAHTEKVQRYAAVERDGQVFPKLTVEAFSQSLENAESTDLLPLLSKLTMPVLVVSCTEGNLSPELGKKMVDTMPNATLAVIEGSNHALLLDKPVETNRIVRDYLDGLDT